MHLDPERELLSQLQAVRSPQLQLNQDWSHKKNESLYTRYNQGLDGERGQRKYSNIASSRFRILHLLTELEAHRQ
jgi:hypothetical protein